MPKKGELIVLDDRRPVDDQVALLGSHPIVADRIRELERGHNKPPRRKRGRTNS